MAVSCKLMEDSTGAPSYTLSAQQQKREKSWVASLRLALSKDLQNGEPSSLGLINEDEQCYIRQEFWQVPMSFFVFLTAKRSDTSPYPQLRWPITLNAYKWQHTSETFKEEIAKSCPKLSLTKDAMLSHSWAPPKWGLRIVPNSVKLCIHWSLLWTEIKSSPPPSI